MPNFLGEITQLWLAENGQAGARISVQPAVRLEPGQYILACERETHPTIPTTLFMAGLQNDTLLTVPGIPPAWQVGMKLSLRGPLGHGFILPRDASKVALAALADHPYRLMGLLLQALSRDCEVVLFTNLIPAGLSPAVEVLPVEQLHEALNWADFIAADLEAQQVAGLGAALGLPSGRHCACKAQALVHTSMPCGATARCGICAVTTIHGWKLACEDGPVFPLNDLLPR